MKKLAHQFDKPKRSGASPEAVSYTHLLNEENLELALNVFSKDNFRDEINAAAPAVLTNYRDVFPDIL